MTVQEANRDALGRCKMRGCNLCDGYREELEQYRALGTVEEPKEAREKQVAKMARIYISGPITGVESFGFKFSEAERKLQEEGHEVINPTKVELLLPKGTYEEYMKIDMFLLDMCDTIYMLKGWEKSCGANREYGYAMAKNYTILQQE